MTHTPSAQSSPNTPGASRKSAVTPEHLAELNVGCAEARTLTEALAIDHRLLLAAAVPDASEELRGAVTCAQDLGILEMKKAWVPTCNIWKMRISGNAIFTAPGLEPTCGRSIYWTMPPQRKRLSPSLTRSRSS